MSEADIVPPSPAALSEAFSLSSEILRNIELNELPLSNIALKSSRLARLLNDFDFQEIMKYEAGGYPSTASGVPNDVWKLGGVAGRHFDHTDQISKKTTRRMYLLRIT